MSPSVAAARGVGTVCFKTFGAGKLLGDTEGYSRPLQAIQGKGRCRWNPEPSPR